MSTLKADLGSIGGRDEVRLPEIAGCGQACPKPGLFPVSLLPQQLTCVMVSVVLLTC